MLLPGPVGVEVHLLEHPVPHFSPDFRLAFESVQSDAVFVFHLLLEMPAVDFQACQLDNQQSRKTCSGMK